MPFVITAFALAIVAVIVAALALIGQERCLRSVKQHSSTINSVLTRLRAYEASAKEHANATLAVAVADLDAALSKITASNRSQFGKLWATLHQLELDLRPAQLEQPASDGERPTRDQLRTQLLRPPFSINKTE